MVEHFTAAYTRDQRRNHLDKRLHKLRHDSTVLFDARNVRRPMTADEFALQRHTKGTVLSHDQDGLLHADQILYCTLHLHMGTAS